MSNERALQQIEDFKRRFKGYGEAALHLAYHAAVPVALNPELLHLIRVNFFLDPPEVIPYDIEFDFLLSPICRQIDEGLYEITPDIRTVFLDGLALAYDSQRINEIATLIWQYTEHYSPWGNRVTLERAQQLTALSFLQPEKASEWLLEAETKAEEGYGVNQDWYMVMRQGVKSNSRIAASGEKKDVLLERSDDNHSKLHIFLSYARKDGRNAATRLRDELERVGFQVWRDLEGMQGGQAWKDQLRRAVRAADVVLVLMTPAAVRSKYVEWEWETALTREKRVIPLLIQNCTIPNDLQHLHCHNLGDEQNYVLGLASLVRDLGQVSDRVQLEKSLDQSETIEMKLSSRAGFILDLSLQHAVIRSETPSEPTISLHEDTIRIGRKPENDLVISEPWVSSGHAEIYPKAVLEEYGSYVEYVFKDFSKYGTFLHDDNWWHIHRNETTLKNNTRMRFGSPQGRIFEFTFENNDQTSLEQIETFSDVDSISAREDVSTRPKLKLEWLQVLDLACREGLKDKAIAHRMSISERTVKKYWVKIQDALEIESDKTKINIRMQIMAKAIQIALVSIPNRSEDIQGDLELKPVWLEVLTLAFQEGLRDTEIADRMSIPFSTVQKYWDELGAALDMYGKNEKDEDQNERVRVVKKAIELGILKTS